MDIVLDKIIMIPTSRKPNSNCLGAWGKGMWWWSRV